MADTHTIRKTTNFLGCVVFFFAFAGCSYFENPITWDESMRSSELVGEWTTVAGSKDQFTASVSNGLEGLEFELVTSEKDTGKIERAMFTGHLLAVEELHVLQIDMNTYREQTGDGDLKNNNEEGYFFAKVELGGNTLLVDSIDFDEFGEAAESVLGEAKVRMGVRDVSRCLDTKLQTDVIVQSLPDLFREDDWNQIAAIVQLPDKDLAKLRGAVDGKNSSIDPFKQLNSLRSCVARKLPSALIEKVIESAPEHVFVGERRELERM